MKTLFKTVLVLISLLSGSYIYAQQLTFSITANAGVGISDMDIQNVKSDPLFSYRAGIGIEYNLPKNFFLQTGIDFATKGAKSKSTAEGDVNGDGIFGDKITSKDKVSLSYLILPVRLGYRLSISDDIRMNLSLGPYLGTGVGGKAKSIQDGYLQNYDGSTNSVWNEHKENSFSSNALKRFDMGLTGNVGIEYKRILLTIGYEYGFIDYSRTDTSAYNNNLYLTLGYRIL